MTEKNVKDLSEWGMDHTGWDAQEWKSVISSNEKKLLFDGPDGWDYCCADIRKEEKDFSNNNMVRNLLWFGHAFHYMVSLFVCFPERRIDGAQFTKTFEESPPPFSAFNHGTDWEFQQDKSPIHRYFRTRRKIHEKGVVVMPWPSRSLDFNPIENVWYVFARRVYENLRQLIPSTSCKQNSRNVELKLMSKSSICCVSLCHGVSRK